MIPNSVQLVVGGGEWGWRLLYTGGPEEVTLP